MSLFKRLSNRLRRGTKEKSRSETEDRPEPVAPAEKISAVSKTPSSRILEPVPRPVGTIVASKPQETVEVEPSEISLAARVTPSKPDEIVPGRTVERDEYGRIHIKIVFYGPSLSGKTTALRWLFANVRSLSKSKIIEISDELGRTTFFDFIPVTASAKIVFDVFTVAGQRRHARNRILVLRGADGVIFMADSRPEAMNENIASIQELRIALGTDRIATLPIVVALNKRDLPNALPVDYMVQMLEVEEYPIYETIATQGKNLLRMFQRILRDALIFKVGL